MLMNTSNYHWAEYPSRSALAVKLADDILAQINSAIARRGRAVMAVSGGSTPLALFAELANRGVDWSKVVITLVDERCVSETHELSNAAFLKTHLLNKLAIQPTFVPLYVDLDVLNSPDYDAVTVAAAKAIILSNFRAMTGTDDDALPGFDVVVLGMGGDGHTASFFPDADNIAELVDAESTQVLLDCNSPSTQVQRITWSLPVLLNTHCLALHFTGADKKMVFERAVECHDGSAALLSELPIRAVIFQQATPLSVYYAD